MATVQTLEREEQALTTYRKLGLANGLLIGLAVVLGAWGSQIVTLTQVPTSSPYGSLLLAGFLIVLLSTFAGWLTARIEKTWATFLIWLGVGCLVAIIINIQASHLRTLAVWLADRRFWGRAIYQVPGFTTPVLTVLAMVLSGFFVFLLLAFLGLVQDMRLERIQGALGKGGRLSLQAVILLLLPLPLVILAGYLTSNIVGGAGSSAALQEVHEAIRTGRTYEGDLFELGLEQGINYSAIRGVREQMSANYVLSIGDVDLSTSSTFIIADFDNGAWIACRALNDQLNFCYDVAPPYTIGLASFITGEEVSEDCRGCVPEADDEWQVWLRARGDQLGSQPKIVRVAQQGGHVLMRAESPSGDYAVECWFEGLSPVELVSCSEVNP